MILPIPAQSYSVRNQSDIHLALTQADKRNHKRGQDIEVSPGRLILTSPNGTRHSITVANDGTISATAI
jgi:hypothetical protein